MSNSSSDISPRSPAPSQQNNSSYFASGCASASRQEPRSFDPEGMLRQVHQDRNADDSGSGSGSASANVRKDTATNFIANDDGSRRRASTISFAEDLPTRRSSVGDDVTSGSLGRQTSNPAVSFQRRRQSSLPQVNAKPTNGSRIRASSPPHDRYVTPFSSFLIFAMLASPRWSVKSSPPRCCDHWRASLLLCKVSKFPQCLDFICVSATTALQVHMYRPMRRKFGTLCRCVSEG